MKHILSLILIIGLWGCGTNETKIKPPSDSTQLEGTITSTIVNPKGIVTSESRTLGTKYADPYISTMTEQETVRVGKYTRVQVRTGNPGNDPIVANSLRIVISVGNNSRITSLAINPYWKQTSLSSEKVANTIVLINKEGLGSWQLADIYVRVRGVSVGDYSTISSNITYITANNPLLPNNALNASQGNADNTNDNSTTSLQVTNK